MHVAIRRAPLSYAIALSASAGAALTLLGLVVTRLVPALSGLGSAPSTASTPAPSPGSVTHAPTAAAPSFNAMFPPQHPRLLHDIPRPSAAAVLAVLLGDGETMPRPPAGDPAKPSTGSLASPGAEPAPRRMRVLVKAYTPWDPIDRDSGWQNGVTSTGVKTDEPGGRWGIAADPGALPYGTRIRVPGYRPSSRHAADHAWPVDDTGGHCRRQWRNGVVQIEVRFITRAAALKWGERWMEVEVFPPRG